MKYYTFYLVILAAFFFGKIDAQIDRKSDLHKLFIIKDSLLFEAGFNKCELDVLAVELSDDLEFYHDQGGFQNKTEFMQAMKDNICSNLDKKLVRKIVPNTLEVFPMYDNGELYGAIVNGKHEFYIRENSKELYKTGSALFSGLWLKEGQKWLAKRIFSYHHQPD